MRYISTRGQSPALSFSEILLGGLAPDGAHPFKILWRVHAARGRNRGDVYRYSMPVPQGAQLFEGLDYLRRSLGQRRELPQEPRSIAIDPDVPQRHRRGQCLDTRPVRRPPDRQGCRQPLPRRQRTCAEPEGARHRRRPWRPHRGA